MFLDKEKSTLDEVLPTLSPILLSKSLSELESGDGRTIFQYFKEHAAPGLFVDAELGGMGLDLVPAVQIHRYVGSLCPSLAIMMTMHNHTIYALSNAMDSSLAAREEVLSSIARDNIILCSGFSEAKRGTNILTSTVTCNFLGDNFILRGSKKPCTMADFADMAMVGVSDPSSEDPCARGIAVVDMYSNNVCKRPFWPSSILTATSSNEILFNGVEVPKHNVVLMESGSTPEESTKAIERSELSGLTSFQLLIASSYLGVASRLASICFAADPRNSTDVSQIAVELESAAMALEGMAGMVDARPPSDRLLALAISVRTLVSQCISRASNLALISLGGMKYLGSSDISYLLQVANCINFHPISRDESIDMIRYELCR